MKLIKAYIRYVKFLEVYHALKREGFFSMTIVDCEGTGMYSDQEREHLSSKYAITGAYRVIKLEILVAEEQVQKIINIIRQNGRTGYQGDGMILVSPVENVYKVRTDDEGFESV